MGVRCSDLAMLAVFVAVFLPSGAGTSCEEVTFEPCTELSRALTGFPNSFGHRFLGQVPASYSRTFQRLIAIGCHDDMRLFLCAAAFPRCTGNGSLLPPCRSLCESVVTECRTWLGQFAEIFAAMDCSRLPDEADASMCVGPNSSSSPVATVTRNQPTKAHMATVYRTKSVNITGPVVMEMPTISRLASPSPGQPSIPLLRKEEVFKKEARDQYQRGTLSINAQLNFTSGVGGHGSTKSRGGHILIQSVDKSVEMDLDLQDTFHHPFPSFGVVLAVSSCLVMVLLLISCAFLRKVFGKSHGGRHPRDGAFYTNPAFNDLPHSTERTSGVSNGNGDLGRSALQPYSLADLPPHPASFVAPPISQRSSLGNIYQQEPEGFIEQNLFVVPQSPSDGSNNSRPEKDGGKTADDELANTRGRPDITPDLVYSNKVTSPATDTNGNERNEVFNGSENNGNVVAPSTVDPVSIVSDSVDNGDMVIANPIAC